MRTARWAPVLLLVGVLLWWLRPTEPVVRPPSPAEPRVTTVTGRQLSGPPAPEPAPLEARFVARAADVREACDLDLDVRCNDLACAGVLTAPDLDRISGWLTLVFESPRFVFSTAARDLGVPPDVLPCGSAVEQLVGEAGVTAVELADGTEVWCTVSGSAEAGRGLCDTLAGRPDVGFGAEGLRHLSFDR